MTVRRGEETRELIFQVAIEAFGEKGYSGCGLREIAARVGIESASLYNHINSKEDLLFQIIMSSSNALIEEVSNAVDECDGSPREKLLCAVRQNIVYHARHPERSFVGTRELRYLNPENYQIAMGKRKQLESIFESLVDECKEAGVLEQRRNTKVIANYLVGLGPSVATWYRAGGDLSPGEVADLGCELIAPGLGSLSVG